MITLVSEFFQGRDHLQSLAFFLVLLTAGFEISIKELKPSTFAFALVPVTLELVGITLWAVGGMGYSVIEGLVLGTTLCCREMRLSIDRIYIYV